MSHFSTITTRIKNKEYLIEALTKANYNFKVGSFECVGYQNQTRNVEILVTVPNTRYNIGFKKEGEYFELVADWYGIRDISGSSVINELENEIKVIENKIKQEYAYNTTIKKLEEQGFEIDEESRENGEIQIKLSRMI